MNENHKRLDSWTSFEASLFKETVYPIQMLFQITYQTKVLFEFNSLIHLSGVSTVTHISSLRNSVIPQFSNFFYA